MNYNREVHFSEKEIEMRLRHLGVTCRHKGFRRLRSAIEIVLEDERHLEAVVKEIYMPVGEKLGCSWKAVERSLRTICAGICFNYGDEIYAVTGIKLKRPPTPAELLDICAVYIRHSYDSVYSHRIPIPESV